MRPIGPKIEPLKEPFELLQIDLVRDHPRPREALLLEPLVPETEPIAMPIERLDLVASSIGEDKERIAK